jgi:hypothetical protein
VLLALALLIVLARLHTYDEPLERDLTTYAVVAHEMLAGRPLYSDLWDHKPPAIHVTYAAAELLFGYGPLAIYVLGVGAALATLLGVYAAGSAQPGGRATGLWAGIFWALVCGSLVLEANQPNAEVFINACLVGGFALLVRAGERPLGFRRALVVGLLFALASLYKQVVVAVPLLLAFGHVAFPPGGPAGRRRAAAEVATITAVGAAAWAAVFGYFGAVGRLTDFCDVVFTYNRHYAQSPLANVLGGITAPGRLMGVIPRVAPLLLGLTAIGMVLGPRRGPARSWNLLVAYALGAHLAVQLPGRWYPHYYQVWLPVLAVGAAWGTEVLRGQAGRFAGLLPRVAAGLTAAQLAVVTLADGRIPAEGWALRKYQADGAAFVESQLLGREIADILPASQTFYVWGGETGLYFASGRSPATGVLYNYPLLQGPFVAPLAERVLADLEAAAPELLVVSHVPAPENATCPPVVAWCQAHYRPYPGEARHGPFSLYIRRGGVLEARLSPVGTPSQDLR